MTQLFANNAVSVLTTQATDIATTLVVADGSSFPSPTNGDYFLATLYSANGVDETNHEIVKVTARSAESLTVVRAQEGTTARTWVVGTPVELRITAETLDGFWQSNAPQTSLTVGLGGAVNNALTVAVSPAAADGIPTVSAVVGVGQEIPRLAFEAGGAERASVGAAGALMVGTTTEHLWGDLVAPIQVGADTALWELGGTTYLSQNCYFDGNNFRYIETRAASRLVLYGGSGTFAVAQWGEAGSVATFTTVFTWGASANMEFAGNVNIATSKVYKVASTQVVGPRQTGWTAATGAANKGSFNTTTAQLEECAERIKALEDALRTHGLIN